VEVRNVAGKNVRLELDHLDSSPVYFRSGLQQADELAGVLSELGEEHPGNSGTVN